jgi:hypothetical protein
VSCDEWAVDSTSAARACVAAPSSYTLSVSATDRAGASFNMTVFVTVTNANDKPTLGRTSVLHVDENYLHPPYPFPSINLSVRRQLAGPALCMQHVTPHCECRCV